MIYYLAKLHKNTIEFPIFTIKYLKLHFGTEKYHKVFQSFHITTINHANMEIFTRMFLYYIYMLILEFYF